MDQALLPFVIGALGFKVVGLFVAIMMHHGHRLHLTRLAVSYWLCLLLAFVFAAIDPSSHVLAIMAISTWVPAVGIMMKIVAHLFSRPKSIKGPMIICCVFQIIAIMTYFFTSRFEVSAFLACLPLSCVLIMLSWVVFRSATQPESFTLALSLFLCAVHVLDYPWLRFNQALLVHGFVFAYLVEGCQLLGIMTTISGHIRRDYTTHLERHVETATQDLRSAEAWKTNLLRILCHDIANGLSGLQLHLHKLRRDLSDHPSQKSIDACHLLTRSQIGLLDNVRTMMLVHTGKMNLHCKSIDLVGCIRTSIQLLEEPIRRKSLNIQLQLTHEVIPVIADEVFLVHSILNNLLTNAIKFSDPGQSIAICFDAGALTIKDEGIGIEPQRLLHLQTEAHPLSTIGTKGESGSGFGLLIVKNLVHLMGGKLSINSTPRTAHEQRSGTEVRILFQQPEMPFSGQLSDKDTSSSDRDVLKS